jgi:hypothetical protein
VLKLVAIKQQDLNIPQSRFLAIPSTYYGTDYFEIDYPTSRREIPARKAHARTGVRQGLAHT